MDVQERAEAYLMKIEPTMCGTQSCHDRTFRAAVTLVKGFGLSPGAAKGLLQKWASKGTHEWTERQIDHKIRQAEKAAAADPGGVGALRDQGAPARAEDLGPKKKSGAPQKKQVSDKSQSKEKRFSKFDQRDTPRPARHGIEEVTPTLTADQEITGLEVFEPAPAVEPEDDPIEAIYGGKRDLWHRIIAESRKEIKRASEKKGAPCRLPDTLLLDERVVSVLPAEIDGMMVKPVAEFAAVIVKWENCEP